MCKMCMYMGQRKEQLYKQTLVKDQTWFNSLSHGVNVTQRGYGEIEELHRKEKVVEPAESLKLTDEAWVEAHTEKQGEKARCMQIKIDMAILLMRCFQIGS